MALPDWVNLTELFELSVSQYKVVFVPGEAFSVRKADTDTAKNCLRLNFSYPSLDDIEEGIERLGSAINYYKSHAKRSGA